jgi:hypothetical protein
MKHITEFLTFVLAKQICTHLERLVGDIFLDIIRDSSQSKEANYNWEE